MPHLLACGCRRRQRGAAPACNPSRTQTAAALRRPLRHPQERDNPVPKFGIIVPLAPFGMPDYDQTERFDLRVRLLACLLACFPA